MFDLYRVVEIVYPCKLYRVIMMMIYEYNQGE